MLIKLRQRNVGAMQVDGAIVASLPHEFQYALAFAEAVGADEMGAIGLACDGLHEALYLVLDGAMAKDRQGKCCFGDEDITGHEFEGRAGWISGAFVVA